MLAAILLIGFFVIINRMRNGIGRKIFTSLSCGAAAAYYVYGAHNCLLAIITGIIVANVALLLCATALSEEV